MPTEWTSFEYVRGEYQKVQEGKTTLFELAKMGFSPEKVSGTEVWDSVLIARELLPNSEINETTIERAAHLPSAGKACLRAGPAATAIKFPLDFTKIETEGNFFAEKLGFKKERRTIGTRGWAWFCYNSQTGIILYKRLYEFTVDELRVERDPLGRLNNLLFFKIF